MSIVEAVGGSGCLVGVIIQVTARLTIHIKRQFFRLRKTTKICVLLARKNCLIVTVL